jgi:uncharacterized protein (TIGR01777 family)
MSSDPDTAQQPALHVAVTGASGLVGTALTQFLTQQGHQVRRLVRREPRTADEARWDPATGHTPGSALEGMDAVVNLAGESIAERWTPERQLRMRASRVDATQRLVSTLATLQRRPSVLVNASAVGYYGDRGDELLTEQSAPGAGFLAALVKDWEAATAGAAQAGVRVVMPRLGVVLSARGGALGKMLPPFRLGLGGPLGSGRQWMSWISLDDVVRVIQRALTDPALSGPINTVAGATRNEDFVAALGHAVHRPALIPVPAFALRLGFGQMAEETILYSQRAQPAGLEAAGHTFLHPTLEQALQSALAEG